MNLMGGNGMLASQNKHIKFQKVADLYLRSGNIIKYCEIMIELNQVNWLFYILQFKKYFIFFFLTNSGKEH
jgi:hypothetical protein